MSKQKRTAKTIGKPAANNTPKAAVKPPVVTKPNIVAESAQAASPSSTPSPAKPDSNFSVVYSRMLPSWLAEHKVSLAFTTYHTNRTFFVGLSPKGDIQMNAQSFPRCMGMWASPDAQTLYLSHMYQILRFESTQDPALLKRGVDRAYVPRHGFTTGDCDIHDIAANKHGLPVFVNTLYSCLASSSPRYSFEPIWKPKFISKLAPEDRCHLNGLAMVDGQPRYVTCVSKSDVHDGWREHRHDGGMVIDITTDDVVAGGLAMPHSPRFYNGKLYVHNSGHGQFGYVDLKTGKFEPIAFCPGYLRGMAFIDDFVVVGLSLSRNNINFSGLPLDDALKKHNAEARCALHIINLNTGSVAHSMRLGGSVQEFYDVITLANTRLPVALNFNKSDLPRLLNAPPPRTQG